MAAACRTSAQSDLRLADAATLALTRTTSPPNGWSSCRTITNHDDEFWRDELVDSASVIGVAALGAILATAS
jgi:hypothetical protein